MGINVPSQNLCQKLGELCKELEAKGKFRENVKDRFSL